MPSTKLHLKETPAERRERDLRRARKASKRRRPAPEDTSSDEAGPSSGKRQHTNSAPSGASYPYVFFDDDDGEYGPPPPPPASSHRAHKPDYDRILAELEEARFREKMFGALEEDERLDGLESRLNDYAHIPRRWRGGGMDRMDDERGMDPNVMEDEDYAEWVREGMWRRKHAAEYEEQEKQKAERAARKARERAVRGETKRMGREEEENRRRRRRSRERRRVTEARDMYDARWKDLVGPSAGTDSPMRFADIPWPVLPPELSGRRTKELTMDDLTVETISAFLLIQDDSEAGKKERKDKLRETMLRFHPDKFEGRILKLVAEDEREIVMEAVGIVVRAVSGLMGDGK
ncbi:uncharacterized protein B0H18DRAFT_885399 [Fomitopsis serialis]|uniref:uncharacterized protein n=1 Tax=Fomitopsis serialis TaxID=139415 RepID=UPI002008846B|nr:uncharacterized protein B0H18DRAFT_885399 [Neoantrodia serialis]KAH9915913.1 hypothetical protein B0H18DRAFT_885399 [Neoantrodia serialis]